MSCSLYWKSDSRNSLRTSILPLLWMSWFLLIIPLSAIWRIAYLLMTQGLQPSNRCLPVSWFLLDSNERYVMPFPKLLSFDGKEQSRANSNSMRISLTDLSMPLPNSILVSYLVIWCIYSFCKEVAPEEKAFRRKINEEYVFQYSQSYRDVLFQLVQLLSSNLATVPLIGIWPGDLSLPWRSRCWSWRWEEAQRAHARTWLELLLLRSSGIGKRLSVMLSEE